jgi:uncharacterized protein YdiU (UPF0061 family)
MLQAERVDYTSTFRALASSLRDDDHALEDLFETPAAIGEWVRRWRARLDTEGRNLDTVAKEMDLANPIYIPRNHLVEEALEAATGGDTGPFHTLLGVVTRPFDQSPELKRFANPSPGSFDQTFQTFCGT